MPIDHVSINVPISKIDGVVNFLTSSLQHLGFKEIVRPVPFAVGLGEQRPYFWITGINLEDTDDKTQEFLMKKQHIAFTAETAEQVRQFHAAALKAGGTCNGPPGLREHYHPGYYGAFVRDPACGLNIEVVCHKSA